MADLRLALPGARTNLNVLMSKTARPLVTVRRNTLSFREVYGAHFRFVWRALHRLGVRPADLMDITQNVFIIVHRKLSAFEGRSELTTWLLAICRRVARDYWHSAPIRREVLVDQFNIDELCRINDGRDAPDKKLRMIMLAKVLLDRLPEKQRTVFLLFFVDDFHRLHDIAARLDIPLGTARSRLRLARRTLKEEAARFERLGVDAYGVLHRLR
jgi:RNA polymerase sigma-70 factor (ECF subfamily)